MIRFAAVLLVVAAWLVPAVPGYAHGGGQVEVEIVSDRGEVLQALPHQSYESGRTRIVKKYLEALRDRTYRIVVRNNSSGRIGVVVAVDGRNIISGRKSYLGPAEEMYLVNAYGSITLDGWRTDERTVHQFFFAEQADSYARRTFGDTSAMGVIAVAAFSEKERYGYLQERSRQQAPSPASSGPAAAKDSAAAGASAQNRAPRPQREAGTGFGDEQYSPVVKVAFEPEPVAFAQTLIKYEWRESLCRKGLLSCAAPRRNRLWEEGSYAPFPPGY